MRLFATTAAVVVIGAAALGGCGSDDEPIATTPTSPTGGAGGSAGSATTTTSSDGGSAGGQGGGDGGAGASGGASTSPGCGLPSATGVIDGNIEAAGEARTYVLSVPAGYEPTTPIPLVFAWHGLGGSGQLARAYFGVEQQAAGAAIFVYPDGLVVQPQDDTGWVLLADGRDVALFDALLGKLRGEYCIDEGRVFSTGHSFGGYMSNALGCARSNVLRAIAPVAGGGPFGGGCDPAPLSAWLAHGTNDEVVAFSEGTASRDHWLAHAGCSTDSLPTTPTGCVEYQGCTSGEVVWCTHEEGHSWPALAPSGIWGFFAALP